MLGKRKRLRPVEPELVGTADLKASTPLQDVSRLTSAREINAVTRMRHNESPAQTQSLS